jgi:hypothetical protein
MRKSKLLKRFNLKIRYKSQEKLVIQYKKKKLLNRDLNVGNLRKNDNLNITIHYLSFNYK